MSFKKPYLAIALLGVALASGAAWWLQNKPAGPKEKVSASGAPGGAPAAAPSPGAPQRPPAVEVA